MQETSELYRNLLADPNAKKEIKVSVSGEEYREDRISSLRTYGGLFAQNTLDIGGAVASEIDLVLYRPGDIPKMAEIRPFYRLTNGEQYSEWIQKGVFYIDTRDPGNEFETLSIHGFDSMLKGERIWEPEQSLNFPMTHRAAALEIARLIGVELENPEDIRTDYYVDYPANGYTQRNILQYIAVAHGGNFIMTDLGMLRLILLNSLPLETNYLIEEHGNAITFGGVRLLV